MEFQTRGDGEIRFYPTLTQAFAAAEQDENIWKISFTIPDTRERVRLVKRLAVGWVFETVFGETYD